MKETRFIFVVARYLCFLCHLSNTIPLGVQYCILKIMYRILPKEVDPIKLSSLRQISLSIALKYIINNSV